MDESINEQMNEWLNETREEATGWDEGVVNGGQKKGGGSRCRMTVWQQKMMEAKDDGWQWKKEGRRRRRRKKTMEEEKWEIKWGRAQGKRENSSRWEEKYQGWDEDRRGRVGGRGEGGGRRASAYEKRWTASQRSLMLSLRYFMKSRSVSSASSPTEIPFSEDQVSMATSTMRVLSCSL